MSEDSRDARMFRRFTIVMLTTLLYAVLLDGNHDWESRLVAAVSAAINAVFALLVAKYLERQT